MQTGFSLATGLLVAPGTAPGRLAPGEGAPQADPGTSRLLVR
jgi:hypothetical protein